MQSLKFVFEATLLAPLVEFATSTSGHVEPRQGLALGWLGSMVAGLAVVFGSADRAQADDCHGIPNGSSDWACSNPPVACDWDHEGNVLGTWDYYYNHSANSGCQGPSSKSCTCPP